jgi:hypothetical protein
MKLTPPRWITFWISLAIVVVGLLAQFKVLTFIGRGNSFWLAFVGFVVLALGMLVKGL